MRAFSLTPLEHFLDHRHECSLLHGVRQDGDVAQSLVAVLARQQFRVGQAVTLVKRKISFLKKKIKNKKITIKNKKIMIKKNEFLMKNLKISF